MCFFNRGVGFIRWYPLEIFTMQIRMSADSMEKVWDGGALRRAELYH